MVIEIIFIIQNSPDIQYHNTKLIEMNQFTTHKVHLRLFEINNFRRFIIISHFIQISLLPSKMSNDQTRPNMCDLVVVVFLTSI